MKFPIHRTLSLLALSAVLFSMTACTTKVTPNPTDTTSSTTPGAFFTQDGLLKEEQKVNAFVAFNFENLKDEMARGQGEYLTSLGNLLGVPKAHQAEFFTLTREKYPVLVTSDNTTPDQMLVSLHRELAGTSFRPSLTLAAAIN